MMVRKTAELRLLEQRLCRALETVREFIEYKPRLERVVEECQEKLRLAERNRLKREGLEQGSLGATSAQAEAEHERVAYANNGAREASQFSGGSISLARQYSNAPNP